MITAAARKQRIEFGDFQTPDALALAVCQRLDELGIRPDGVIEPTCGVGAFVVAAAQTFPTAKQIMGFEVNTDYLETLRSRLQNVSQSNRVALAQADFFATNWQRVVDEVQGSLLVLGNFPWVTSSTQGGIDGKNLPRKANFQQHQGLDAITGKANFDISEWMLLEVFRWMEGRRGDVAMLVKTAIARKVLAHAQRQGLATANNCIIKIDAKKTFNVSVDACLLIMRFGASTHGSGEYTVFDGLEDTQGQRVGYRMGLSIADLDAFDRNIALVGQSPEKWRSGIKHDAAAVMELTRHGQTLQNGYGESVELESDYLYPLMKGSDIGSGKGWRKKYLLVTQRYVGESTDCIRTRTPKTWAYLQKHAGVMGARASSIYIKNPSFSIFGVGAYSFRPWRIAICGLYKSLDFRLIAPIEGKPVMFDDTVYYLSFDEETEAQNVFALLNSDAAKELLSSLIFWDEKRPVKASILNLLDWSRLQSKKTQTQQCQLLLGISA
ncbi:MAG: SAM-dependent methyltransferase [Thiothrix lacustris]|uniref:site-specific DNA-methyltransferase (adenine-specific) n=1 Tax=Thiothrix lacustris TaxID=525917 RepID=A0A1Y1QLP9_9GAMM|nr:MAG: SAM-dependent methyltransferase [Thiothrix lacustris]